jgi:hypothetical protein
MNKKDFIILLASIATIASCIFGFIFGAPPAIVALRELWRESSPNVGVAHTAAPTTFIPKPTETRTLPPSTSTPQPTYSTVITPQPTPTERASWAVSWEWRFSAGWWSIGNHQYSIEQSCPTLPFFDPDRYAKWSSTFQVSKDAPLFSRDVYLRFGGLKDSPIGGADVAKIHPSQPTTAVFTWSGMTRSKAEIAFKDCKMRVSWDGEPQRLMSAGLPYEP